MTYPSQKTPDEPVTPASAMPGPGRRVPKTVFFGVCVGFLLTMLAVSVGTVMVIDRMIEREHTRALAANEAVLRAITEGVSKGVADAATNVMSPPSNDKLFTILSKGLGVTDASGLRTTSVGAVTPLAMFATDLTTAQQTDAYTQLILVQNTHATQNICIKPFAWTDTCANVCAASGLTCSGAATDGWRLSPGQVWSIRWDGTNCGCIIGSGAGTSYQDLRVVR